MLTVPTQVRASEIHGLGLFSQGSIVAGQVVWTFHPKIDHTYTRAFLETVPACVAEQLSRYCYVNPEEPEVLVVCGDDARFLNFPRLKAIVAGGGVAIQTERANLALGERFDGEFRLVAERDIAAGEELTVPIESDADAANKLTSF